MRVALVNPSWRFDHSIYFGCREAHLPLELGSAKVLLEQAGHTVLMLDGALTETTSDDLADQVSAFVPHMTVVTTAPSYLFWRCAPPELRSPRDFMISLMGRGRRTVAVGPHGSAAPRSTRRKLEVDIVVLGECEEALVEIASGRDLASISGLCHLDQGVKVVTGAPAGY